MALCGRLRLGERFTSVYRESIPATASTRGGDGRKFCQEWPGEKGIDRGDTQHRTRVTALADSEGHEKGRELPQEQN